MKNLFNSRKVILFIITMIACGVLLFFGKDVMPLITLYGVYCAGNVGSKVSYNLDRGRKE